MNSTLLISADGRVFFLGLMLVVLSLGFLLPVQGRALRSAWTVSAVAGFIFVAVSATPLPRWGYTIWSILALAGVIFPMGTKASTIDGLHLSQIGHQALDGIVEDAIP